MNEEIREAIEYWQDKGKKVAVFFHNSYASNLDEFEFHYRQCNSSHKGYSGEGIFTHSNDPYFSKFGTQKYAVLTVAGNGQTREEELGNRHYETFIQKSAVLEMIQI